MQVHNDAQPYDTINVTPMLDLAYVLLVVFILMTTASLSGMKVTMPKPSNTPTLDKRELKIVQVMPGGVLLLDGAPLSLEELESRLVAARARDPKTTVAIRGDARATYAPVVAVIDLCNRLGLDMGLITARIGT
jgi:biopolymer transport protein ExbD